MFMIEANPNREMKIVLRGVKKKLGEVPPHFELFATLNPIRFKMFLEELHYLSTHERIHPDFFAFVRYSIAYKNSFSYCYEFNQKLLLSKGYTLELLKGVERSTDNLPLDEKHQALFKETLNAIDSPDNFTLENMTYLKSLGWLDSDIYDAIDHGSFLFKFSKVLKAYATKK